MAKSRFEEEEGVEIYRNGYGAFHPKFYTVGNTGIGRQTQGVKLAASGWDEANL